MNYRRGQLPITRNDSFPDWLSTPSPKALCYLHSALLLLIEGNDVLLFKYFKALGSFKFQHVVHVVESTDQISLFLFSSNRLEEYAATWSLQAYHIVDFQRITKKCFRLIDTNERLFLGVRKLFRDIWRDSNIGISLHRHSMTMSYGT